jgi:hypothetical protein
MNEAIAVEGDRAHALWYLDCPCVFRAGNPAGVEGSGFINGRYWTEYVR